MTERVPVTEIEQIVGVVRHSTLHFARTGPDALFILHSERCWDAPRPLVECEFSLALDKGADEAVWSLYEDRAVQVDIDHYGHLVPARTELA